MKMIFIAKKRCQVLQSESIPQKRRRKKERNTHTADCGCFPVCFIYCKLVVMICSLVACFNVIDASVLRDRVTQLESSLAMKIHALTSGCIYFKSHNVNT